MSVDSQGVTTDDERRTERRGPGVVGPLAVCAALISAVVTFVILTGRFDIEPTEEVTRFAVAVNAGFVLLLLDRKSVV